MYRNRFEEASLVERRLTKEFLVSTGIAEKAIYFTDAKSYAAYDGSFYVNGQKIMFEVKVRNVSSDRYENTVIEQGKYNYLMACAKNSGVKPYIIIFFTDGKVLVKNIEHCEVKLSEKYAPITTAIYTGKKVKNFMEIPFKMDELAEYNDYRITEPSYDDDGWR